MGFEVQVALVACNEGVCFEYASWFDVQGLVFGIEGNAAFHLEDDLLLMVWSADNDKLGNTFILLSMKRLYLFYRFKSIYLILIINKQSFRALDK